MSKKTSLIIGAILVFVVVLFVGYALEHPEAVFLRNIRATYMIYGAYLWLVFKFLLDIPFLKNIRNKEMTKERKMMACVLWCFIAIVILVIELTGNKVDGYTILRGFVVIGACDVAIEYLRR